MKTGFLPTARLSFPLTATIAALLAAPSVNAAIITWDADATTTALPTDGGGAWLATGQWWDGAANLDWTSGDDAVFGNTGGGGAVTLTGPTTVNSLTFNSFTGTYTLGDAARTITLNNGITKNASGTGAATIISPVTLGAAQTWTNLSPGLLTIGTAAVTNGSNLLTIDGTGNTTISSVIGSGDGGLTKNGPGTLTLSNAANSYSGGTVISAGTVSISANGNLGNPAGGITFANTSTLSFGGAVTSARPITLSSGTATINMTVAATHVLSGKVTGAGSLSFTQTAGAGGHNYTLSALNNDFTGAISINSGGSGQSASLTVNSLKDSVGAGNISISSNAGGVSAGSSTSFIYGSGATSTLLLDNRRINLIGNGSNTNSSGAIFNNANTTHAITVNTDLLVSGPNGKMTLSAAAGPTNVFAGKITNSGSTGGVVIIKAGAGTWTLSGDNTHSGGTTLSAGKLNINSATALGTGTFTVGAATFDNTSIPLLTLTSNNPQTWNGDFTFTGTHSLNLGTGAVTLGATRSIIVSANTLTVGGVIGAAAVSPGILKTTGDGTLVFNGANTYAGPTTISAGTLQIGNANALGFGGLVTTTISGTTASTGALDLNGVTGVSEPITLSGTGISSNGAVVNNNTGAAASIGSGIAGIKLPTAPTGTAYSTPPTITISGTGSGATATASLGLTTASINAITNGGTASWAVSNTLSVTGGSGTGAIVTVTSVNGSGQITGLSITTPGSGYTSAPTTLTRLTGSGTGTPTATFFANQFTVSGVRMTAAGSGYTGTPTYTFDSGNAIPGTTTLSSVALASNSSIGGAGNTTIDAVVSGGFSLTKVGAGILTLTAVNTYTGTTNVNSGTLALGANNVLPDTAVSIGSATLNAATFSDTVGTLDVTAAATINLGSGATLAFDPGSPAWTGTLNLTGTFVPGSSLRFGSSDTALDDTQLGLITATGWTSFDLDANGYLIATSTGGNTFADWLALNPPATGFVTDSDNDGLPNGVENVLGSNPNTYNAGLTEVSSSMSSVVFTHTLNPTIASDVTYSYQWSTDLTEWKASTETNTGTTTATIVPSPPALGVVTVTITITGGPSAKLFGRLVAVK